MKRLFLVSLMAALMIPSIGIAQSALIARAKSQTQFVGVISEARLGHRTAPAQAIASGIAGGDQATLVERSTAMIYIIANPSSVAAFAGEHVRVTGTFDGTKLTVASVCRLGPAAC